MKDDLCKGVFSNISSSKESRIPYINQSTVLVMQSNYLQPGFNIPMKAYTHKVQTATTLFGINLYGMYNKSFRIDL